MLSSSSIGTERDGKSKNLDAALFFEPDEIRGAYLLARMAERQAKVAQELAIARRIENADDVEIEEFYDVIGTAHAGLKKDEVGFTAGLGGQGQKLMRRVYRSKGQIR